MFALKQSNQEQLMTDAIPPQPPKERATHFQLLRQLFIAGYAIALILFFVPSIEITSRTHTSLFSAPETSTDSYSTFEITRLLGKKGEMGLQLFVVASFAISAALLILAITYPKRWVFITGASMTAFFLLWNLFSAPDEHVKALFLPAIVGYISSGLALLGFFVRPPRSQPREEAISGTTTT